MYILQHITDDLTAIAVPESNIPPKMISHLQDITENLSAVTAMLAMHEAIRACESFSSSSESLASSDTSSDSDTRPDATSETSQTPTVNQKALSPPKILGKRQRIEEKCRMSKKTKIENQAVAMQKLLAIETSVFFVFKSVIYYRPEL